MFSHWPIPGGRSPRGRTAFCDVSHALKDRQTVQYDIMKGLGRAGNSGDKCSHSYGTIVLITLGMRREVLGVVEVKGLGFSVKIQPPRLLLPLGRPLPS
jgi:hypothetical protein